MSDHGRRAGAILLIAALWRPQAWAGSPIVLRDMELSRCGIHVDVFYPNCPDSKAVYHSFVFVPGGGWNQVDKTSMDDYSWTIANYCAGMAVQIEYPVTSSPASGDGTPHDHLQYGPGLRWPAPYEALKCAVEIVQSAAAAPELRLTGRVAVMGLSAGGQLAQRLAMEPPGTPGRPQAAVSVGGPSDMVHLYNHTQTRDVQTVLELLLGGPPIKAHLPKYTDSTPIHWVSRDSVPLQLHQGMQDALVPWEEAQSMCKAMNDAGGTCAPFFYPGEGHVFGAGNRVNAYLRSVNFMLHMMTYGTRR